MSFKGSSVKEIKKRETREAEKLVGGEEPDKERLRGREEGRGGGWCFRDKSLMLQLYHCCH